ncbi:MAG: hypothetical protein JW910_05685 [Anaerolineae bacterium]|nr:hypothetical protein [Anaerolineae bacterium]
MDTAQEYDLTDLDRLCIHAEDVSVETWQGRRALKLVSGLVLLPSVSLSDARIDVRIGADKAAYPGIAFRALDRMNYELAYAQPHTSGQWDALQYDPVFHGSNTWQLYRGLPFQAETLVPTGEWFDFRLEFKDRRAWMLVNDQPPLVIEELAHSQSQELFGLWTYLPAYFCDLRVSPCAALPPGVGHAPITPAGAITEWFLDGYGVVACEPGGVLNLNRFLPTSVGEARLTRQFELLSAETITLSFGFSDELVLSLDDKAIFEGRTLFSGFADYASRGYVEPDAHTLQHALTPGIHTLSAVLRVTESFGWGLILSVQGNHLGWPPACVL